MSESHEAHGGVKLYWVFCIILCVITYLEWLIFEKKSDWSLSDAALIISLSVCSIIKFVMVVGWYMHLRYDPKIVKNTFIFSLILASAIMAGLLVLLT